MSPSCDRWGLFLAQMASLDFSLNTHVFEQINIHIWNSHAGREGSREREGRGRQLREKTREKSQTKGGGKMERSERAGAREEGGKREKGTIRRERESIERENREGMEREWVSQ